VPRHQAAVLLAGWPVVARMFLAATNKSLAKSNKSRTGIEATNKHNRLRTQQQGHRT